MTCLNIICESQRTRKCPINGFKGYYLIHEVTLEAAGVSITCTYGKRHGILPVYN